MNKLELFRVRWERKFAEMQQRLDQLESEIYQTLNKFRNEDK
jgi:hypothetical protein